MPHPYGINTAPVPRQAYGLQTLAPPRSAPPAYTEAPLPGHGLPGSANVFRPGQHNSAGLYGMPPAPRQTYNPSPARPVGVRAPAGRTVMSFAEYKSLTAVSARSRCKATREIDNVVQRFLASPNDPRHYARILRAQENLPNVSSGRRRDLLGTQLSALIALAALAGTVALAAGIAAQPQNRSGGSGSNGDGGWSCMWFCANTGGNSGS